MAVTKNMDLGKQVKSHPTSKQAKSLGQQVRDKKK